MGEVVRSKDNDLGGVANGIRGICWRTAFERWLGDVQIGRQCIEGPTRTNNANEVMVERVQPFPKRRGRVPGGILRDEIDVDARGHFVWLLGQRRGNVGHGDRTDIRAMCVAELDQGELAFGLLAQIESAPLRVYQPDVWLWIGGRQRNTGDMILRGRLWCTGAQEGQASQRDEDAVSSAGGGKAK